MFFSRKQIVRGLIAAVYGALLSTVAIPSLAKAPSEAEDLAYGVTLYHFFQQQYFDALTEVMVATERGLLPHHQEEANLLRGGMSLSYGLDRQAEDIFNQLLAQLGSPEQVARAWFYLGKLQYQRRDRDVAFLALSHSAEDVSNAYSEEARYMRAIILLEQGDFDAAEIEAAGIPAESIWLPYYWFNYGTRLILSGEIEEGLAQFRRFDDLQNDADELKTLRDRAYTAAGFAYLSLGEFDLAHTEFTRVRLHSPLVDHAMLGLGWTAAQRGLYVEALSPWQALSKRSLLEPAVQESYLAIPFVYEKIGANASALASYQSAVDAYEIQLQSLRQSIAWFKHQPLDGLFDIRRQGSDEWLIGGEVLPVSDKTETLAHLISRHEFQSTIKNLRDLNTLSRNLSSARNRLRVMTDVDADQQAAWTTLLDTSALQDYRARYVELSDKTELLKQQLHRAEQEKDGRLIANAKTRALWQRLEHAQGLLDVLQQAGEDVSEQTRQLQMFRGQLAWQSSEEYSTQHWQFQGDIQSLEDALESTGDSLARLDKLSYEKTASAYAEQIDAMKLRVDETQLTVDEVIAVVEGRIRQLAVDELELQQSRITQYLSQAKLAIARMYDASSGGGLEQPEDSEPADTVPEDGNPGDDASGKDPEGDA